MSASLARALSPRAIVLILTLAACSRTPPADGPAADPSGAGTPTGADTATLENTYWRATAINDRPVRVDENLTEPHLLLQSDDTQASGSTGCNGFSGGYQLSGDSLRFGDLLSTLRACVDPELNRQERAFLDALGGTRTWRVTRDTLVLSGQTGPLVRFTAQER
jgi:heat shock protein HslJ